MKKILLTLVLAIGSQFALAEEPKKETKTVCVDVKKDGQAVVDSKTGKTKQTCRQVKQHKKLDGTSIPEKK